MREETFKSDFLLISIIIGNNNIIINIEKSSDINSNNIFLFILEGTFLTLLIKNVPFYDKLFI